MQILVSGIALGSLYALIAYGYALTFTTTRTLNFAQGDFLMVGAVVALVAYSSLHVPLVGAILLGLGVLAVMGVLVEQIAVRPVRAALSLGWVMSTVGVSLILRNAAQALWGTGSERFPSPFSTNVINIAGAGILPQELFATGVALALMLALLAFLRFSIYGKALTALASDPETARLMGVNVGVAATSVYVVSSVLAGIAGVLVAPIVYTSVYMGVLLGLKSFAAAIIGGLDNPLGILLAGLGLGVAELGIGRLDATWRDPAIFGLIILFLTIRPHGLLGARHTVNA